MRAACNGLLQVFRRYIDRSGKYTLDTYCLNDPDTTSTAGTRAVKAAECALNIRLADRSGLLNRFYSAALTNDGMLILFFVIQPPGRR